MKRLISTALVVSCTVFAAGCGDSPEDNAREAGEQIGQELHKMRTATSAENAGEAIDNIRADVTKAQEELPAELRDQVSAITEQFADDASKATDRAGVRSAYLEAVAAFNALASDTNSVINEFRRGVRDGLVDN